MSKPATSRRAKIRQLIKQGMATAEQVDSRGKTPTSSNGITTLGKQYKESIAKAGGLTQEQAENVRVTADMLFEHIS